MYHELYVCTEHREAFSFLFLLLIFVAKVHILVEIDLGLDCLFERCIEQGCLLNVHESSKCVILEVLQLFLAECACLLLNGFFVLVLGE